MRIAQGNPLTFSVVDGLGFAAANGRLSAASQTAPYLPETLGPLLELLCLFEKGQLLSNSTTAWMARNGASSMIDSLRKGDCSWIDSAEHRTGFIRAIRDGENGEVLFTKFLMEAQRAAAQKALLPGTSAKQLIAAMQEMHDNILEHSDAPNTGVLAFRATPGIFEFVALDRGIGVLESLRKSKRYRSLSDCGKALEVAITEGASRFDTDARRGFGFRPIFLGLVDLYGSLRFRSGDYSLLIDGANPGPAAAQVAQKPFLNGFLVSVNCRRIPIKSEDANQDSPEGW
jgi:hypothetical protein